MAQIVPAANLTKRPGIGQSLAEGLGLAAQEAIPNIANLFQQKKEDEALKKVTGKDFSGISPEMKKILLQSMVSSHANKQQEKTNALNVGLKTIQEMRNLKESGYLGTKLNPSNLLGLATEKGRSTRAEYETLGRSLIPLVAANVAIRNQKEFDEYRKIITDPSSTEASIEGALNGLEKLLISQLQESESGFMESLNRPSKSEEKSQGKLSKEKAQEILKKAGNDKAKARRLALEMGYEL